MRQKVVIDVCVAAGWLLPDEDVSLEMLDSLETSITGIVPALFWYELTNLLSMAARRRRIGDDFALNQLAECRAMALVTRQEYDEAMTMRLALKHGLTAYDAAYLSLAIEENTTLATRDTRLSTAAKAENIAVAKV